MSKKSYLLLDNARYLGYVGSHLKDNYIPIACDAYIESYLKSRTGSAIGIFDYLSRAELDTLTQETSSLVDAAIARLDGGNRKLYCRIFGRDDVNLIYASMNYLFKRFVIGSMRLIKGLEAILEREPVAELYYLHDGFPVNICGNRMQNSFFFPDNILWDLITAWNYAKKPALRLMHIERGHAKAIKDENSPMLKKFTGLIEASIRDLKDCLKKIKPEIPAYSPRKKNILLMSPFYDLEFFISSSELKSKYNLIIWHVDEDVNPVFLKNQPQSSFFRQDCRQGDVSHKAELEEYLGDFNFGEQLFDRPAPVNIDLKSFLIPLIKSFLKEKLSHIVSYWKAAEELHKTTEIGMFFWGNPPHRYPVGIVKEFFRLNKIPVFGMQHGGVYGSNYMGRTIFDLDLNHCDYYFSYGFDTSALCAAYPNEKKLPTAIPVGSILISRFFKRYNSVRHREKIKILYPLTVTFNNIFIAPEFTIPNLFSFQMKIIDVLAGFGQSKTVLKFPHNSYAHHCLRPYIEEKYPGIFRIIDNIPYQRCLEMYEAEVILIEQQSTPLNESLVTQSNIIAYNDSHFIKLTPEAYDLLKKRAVICNNQEDFLTSLKKYTDNNELEAKDLGNMDFFKKYCVYNNQPEENIIDAIEKYNGKKY